VRRSFREIGTGDDAALARRRTVTDRRLADRLFDFDPRGSTMAAMMPTTSRRFTGWPGSIGAFATTTS
jgi:hypothetical protein